jgi:hypothetical protein
MSSEVDTRTEHQTAIVALANELHVPICEVSKIYSERLEQLASSARIRSYLTVLAMRHTRSILRDSGRSHPSGRS